MLVERPRTQNEQQQQCTASPPNTLKSQPQRLQKEMEEGDEEDG